MAIGQKGIISQSIHITCAGLNICFKDCKVSPNKPNCNANDSLLPSNCNLFLVRVHLQILVHKLKKMWKYAVIGQFQ